MPGLLIKHGAIFNGKKNGFFTGDIVIRDHVIEEIDSEINADIETINAEGLIVSPGFIDAHGHSGVMPVLDCDGGSRLYDGVTTEVCGNCGWSVFPYDGSYGRNKRLEPFTKTPFSLESENLGQYGDMIQNKGMPINLAFMVGHGVLRSCIAGRDNRTLTRDELKKMIRMFEEDLDQGAIGLSLGFAYPPGCFANAEEIIPLAELIKKKDLIITAHIRNESEALLESLEEFISIGERTGCKVQISHLKAQWKKYWDYLHKAVEYIEEKRNKGVDITADRYPYTASQTSLDYLLPTSFFEGGDEKTLERLRDRSKRDELEQWMVSKYGLSIFDNVQLGIMGEMKDAKNLLGRRVSEISKETGKTPFETFIHLLEKSKLEASAVYHSMAEENLETVLSLPFVCVGSDSTYRSIKGTSSTGFPHPRSYGTFARVLSRYCRERKLLTLEEALHKMTGFTADRFGLKKRGYIKKGYKADITVFDPERIKDNAVYENPHQYSEGVEYVIVNGKIALEKGKLTGVNAGEVIR